MWENAGPRRTEARLERLLSDPYPLARLVAASAIARAESRGVHQRSDHPIHDAALDRIHLVVEPDGGLRSERWP
jgi:L-aspartate oxidase